MGRVVKEIKKVGIIAKLGKQEAIETISGLTGWLKDEGIDTVIDNTTAKKLGRISNLTAEEIPRHSDMVIVLGGDGTLLYAARLIGKTEIPILGVNLGSLGFLTEVALPELYNVLKRVISGDFRIEERMMLKAQVKGGGGMRGGRGVVGGNEEFFVLNDVVINKGALARIINLEVKIDGKYLTTYNADGLIVSTPTGSTGYSMSAGGPIVQPTLQAIIITPISPHTLTNRPILVPGDSIIEVSLTSKITTGVISGDAPSDSNVFITLDGQVGVEFDSSKKLTILRAKRKVHLIEPLKRDYYEVLRTKLKWGGG